MAQINQLCVRCGWEIGSDSKIILDRRPDRPVDICQMIGVSAEDWVGGLRTEPEGAPSLACTQCVQIGSAIRRGAEPEHGVTRPRCGWIVAHRHGHAGNRSPFCRGVCGPARRPAGHHKPLMAAALDRLLPWPLPMHPPTASAVPGIDKAGVRRDGKRGNPVRQARNSIGGAGRRPGRQRADDGRNSGIDSELLRRAPGLQRIVAVIQRQRQDGQLRVSRSASASAPRMVANAL